MVTKNRPMVPDAAAVLGFAVYSTLIVLGLMLLLDILQSIFLPQIKEGTLEHESIKRGCERYLDMSQLAISASRLGDAKRLAKKALTLNDQLVEAWLIMAATSEPEESLGYLQKVLKIDPQNTKAKRGIISIKDLLEIHKRETLIFPHWDPENWS